MRIAFDIGGVISKYPDQFRMLIIKLLEPTETGIKCDVFVITDMHKKDDIMTMLHDNGFDMISEDHVYCADYQKHGEFCKAVLLKELNIDLFLDDFIGYTQWDSSLGDAPVRLLVAPDGFKSYWSEQWKTRDKSDFGRRVYKKLN